MNVLITGANRGLGLEFARQYAQAGWQVHACCRAPEQASQLQNLADAHSNVRVHALDVGNERQIEALSAKLASETLDLLINNAGIYPGHHHVGNELSGDAAWIDGFRINAIAPLRMSLAFAPQVAASQRKCIVNLTSKMGSMDDNTSGGSYLYRSSKAALNAISKSLAIDLAPQGITVLILHPGWVLTDMGGPNALISPAESVSGMRQVIEHASLQQSGCFIAYDGKAVPW